MQNIIIKKSINALTIFLIALQLLYPFKALFPSYVQIPVFLIWLILCIFYDKSFLKDLLKKNIVLFVLVLITLFRVVFSKQIVVDFYSPFMILLGLYQFFTFYSLFLFYKNSLAFRLKIVNYSILFALISAILSLIYIIFFDKYAVRYALQSQYFGVADFEFVYFSCITIAILVYYFTNKSYIDILNHQFYFFSLIVLILFVIFSNLLTAVILMIVFSFISIYLKKKLSIKKMILCVIFLFFIIFIFRNPISDLLRLLVEKNLFNELINYKILGIANFLSNSGDTFGISIRLELIITSLNSFFKNPLFGINYAYYGISTLGLHAEWFDDLARFGIFGFAMLIYSYYSLYKEQVYLPKDDHTLFSYSWIMFIILGFFNPNMMASIFLCLTFLSSIEINDKYLSDFLDAFKKKDYCNGHINIDSELLLGDNSQKVELTIVIPTYKRTRLLLCAVKSALNQEERINYKILIIDNNPNETENLEQLKNFKSEKILYYKNKENLGMFGNINRGIFLANSEYIALLHDDDILLPNYLNLIRTKIGKVDCYIPKRKIIGDKEIIEKLKISILEKILKLIATPQRILYKLSKRDRDILIDYSFFSRRNIYGPPSCGVLFKKNIWKEIGGFKENFYPSSDNLFFLMINIHYSIIKGNEIVAAYRWENNESLNKMTIIQFAKKSLIVYSNIPSYAYQIERERFKNEIDYSIVYKEIKYFPEFNKKHNIFIIKFYFYQLKRLFYFYSHKLDDFIEY